MSRSEQAIFTNLCMVCDGAGNILVQDRKKPDWPPLVVTSYFHGTLLSLVQGTPAVVLDYSGYCDTCYESKLKDLMITRLSLPELYYDQTDAVSFKEASDFLKKTEELLAGKYDEKIRNEITKEQQGLHKFLKVLEDDMHRQKSTC